MANILVDTTIAMILFGSLYEGYRRGLITTLVGLAGFTTVLLLCLAFGEVLSRPFKPYIPLPVTYATLAAYILICFGIALASYFLHHVFHKLLTKKLPPSLDAIGGMLAGILRGAAFTALCLLILMLMANPAINDNISHQSRIGGAFFNKVSRISPTINDIFTAPPSPVANKGLQRERTAYEEAYDSVRGKH
jgi:uncharacterized membrane protein required for colicin V production